MQVIDVIDNFLPEYQFKQLQSVILSTDFSWYWNDNIIVSKPKTYQFTHGIYIFDNNTRLVSKYYSLFDIVQQKLRVSRLDRIKSNLNPRTFFHRNGGYHVDMLEDGKHEKTAVLYLNTNNGWTEFKKGGKVKSVANRIVIFDSNLEHTGVTCTNEKRRVIVNFNYDV